MSEHNYDLKKHRLLLISTGGTIAGEVAKTQKSVDYETIKAAAFSELVESTVDSIRNENGIELIIEPLEFCEVDSSDIKPDHWSDLAQIIYDKYDEFDSFIITHGTNTLGYTCAALSFSLLNNAKRIVLTGSQVPIGMPGSDAKTNLDNAIRIAIWTKHDIYGVVAVFGSHVITGTRVKKSTEFDYDAFKSFNTTSIGRIGRIIEINEDNLNKHNSYLKGPSYPLALRQNQLKLENKFNINIVSLTEFPGMNHEIFMVLVRKLEVKGFILRSFGAGDASSSLIPALEELKREKIPVVITTQAPNGNATLQVNEPGQYLKNEDLAIPAYDMGIEAQTAKLAWLLYKFRSGDITYELLKEKMITDMRGEVKVMWESPHDIRCKE